MFTSFMAICSEEQRLASELDYLVFRRILTPVQVCHDPAVRLPLCWQSPL